MQSTRIDRTTVAKDGEVERAWHLVDVDQQILGRVASQIAVLLMGKHKASYTPHVDSGDFVVVINAEKIRVTGKKEDQHKYERFSGYPGGLKEVSLGHVRKTHPERIIQKAVRRMLPKTKLGDRMFRKLKVYAGGEHPHAAQAPEPYDPSAGTGSVGS